MRVASTQGTPMASVSTLKTQLRLSVGILIAGTALLIYMILVEGELGALPLFLFLFGIVGYLICRFRLRKTGQ